MKIKNSELALLAVVCPLAMVGLLSGLMYSLVQGIQNGDWSFLAIFLIIVSGGGFALGHAIRQWRRLLKDPPSS